MSFASRNTLAIFCLYAPDGVIRFRVTYILEQLLTIADELVIVSNGDVSEDGKEVLGRYTDRLIIRENIGFDGGAYADVIVNHIGREKLRMYEAVILCNDTFWGPFVPFRVMCDKMKNSVADYWGINKVDAGFLSYIQSYFLYFRSSIVSQDVIYDFFKERQDAFVTNEIYDIYIYFELALHGYMNRLGYKSDVYTFAHNACVYESPAQCYIKYGLPILKTKALAEEYYRPEQIPTLLESLKNQSDYPIEEIINEIEDSYGITLEFDKTMDELNDEEIPTTIPDYSADEFITFTGKYDRTYIYGPGLLGKKICYTIGEDLHNMCGFLISDGRDITESEIMGLPVIHYSERDNDSCMIMALDRHNSRQVYDALGNDGDMMYLFKKYNAVGG